MIQTSFALLFIVTLEQYHVQHYWSRKVNYGGTHGHIGLYTWVSYAFTNNHSFSSSACSNSAYRNGIL